VQHLGAAVAAREGHIDEVILPDETRRRLGWAFATLDRRDRGERIRNIPL
jgi:propionyl-CoA carboxylase beta chain